MTLPSLSLELKQVLSTTESVCPVCLGRIPARRVRVGDEIFLEKACPEHGGFRTPIWRGGPAFETWVRPKTPAHPANPFTAVERGCPYDCGLCAEHRQHTCCVLFELTQRCDLGCPLCFASAGPPASKDSDPGLETIEGWYRRLLEAGGPYNIQLSGGEPCLRDDLPEIIRLGRRLGFSFFQLNTNGLRLARDPGYLSALVEAGLSTVFLQFDGVSDDVYQSLRGRALLQQKMRAVENCLQAGVGVMLVPTLVPGVNDGQVGAIIGFALERMPGVRGVHFQPVSYFGRYPAGAAELPPAGPADAQRLTLPEVMQRIEAQSGGRIRAENFRPPGGENALCSFHGNFVVMPDGSLHALTRHNPSACCGPVQSESACCEPVPAESACCGPVETQSACCEPVQAESACCEPEDGATGAARSRQFVARAWAAPQPAQALPVLNGPSFGEWDVFLQRARTHTFCLSGMAFQDAWNLDLERLKDCYIHVMSPDGRLVPFCAYNLTSHCGQALYRGVPA